MVPLFFQGASFYLVLLKLLKNVQISYSDIVNLFCGLQKSPFHPPFVCLLQIFHIHGAVDPQTAISGQRKYLLHPQTFLLCSLPLFAAAPSCDQSVPTMPYVDTCTLTVVDGLKKEKKTKMLCQHFCTLSDLSSLDAFSVTWSIDIFFFFLFFICT